MADLDVDRLGTAGLEGFDPARPGPGARARALSRLARWGLLSAVVIVVVNSALNYFDVALPSSSPSSGISEPDMSRPALAAPPTGVAEWTFDAGAPIIVPPLAADGVVFLVAGRTSGTSRVVALDQDTGREVWTHRPGTVVDDRPVVAGEYLYLAMRAGRVVALDRRTGRERWSFRGDDLSHGRPVVRDGTLYFASRSLYALDAVTGQVRWKHDLEGGRAISPLVHSAGIVAALSSGNHLNLVDAHNGKRRYSSPLWFGPAGGPTVVDGRVVVSGDHGRVQAFDLYARDVPAWKGLRFWWVRLWSWDMAPRPPGPLGYSWHHRGIGGLSARVVAASGDSLFLALRESDHTGGVTALDVRSGEVIWSFQTDSAVSEWATLAGDGLIIGTAGGSVYGLGGSSGKVNWEFHAGSPVAAVSVDDRGSVLAATASGAVHSIR